MKQWSLWLVVGLLPAAANAQDGVMIGGDSMMWSVPDHGSAMLAQSVMRSAFSDDEAGSRASAGHGGSAGNGAGGDTRVRYDATVSQQVEREYLAGLARRAGQPAADRFAEHFRARPMHGQFAIAAGPYGLRKEDLADVTAAYFTVMWMVANDAPVPGKPEVAGVRRQVQALLARPGAVPAGPAQRQRLAESLMYKLVSMILLREDAQRRGDAKALRELARAAQLEAGKGFDLKATRLTNQGLVARS